jgi:hypothetical protein
MEALTLAFHYLLMMEAGKCITFNIAEDCMYRSLKSWFNPSIPKTCISGSYVFHFFLWGNCCHLTSCQTIKLWATKWNTLKICFRLEPKHRHKAKFCPSEGSCRTTPPPLQHNGEENCALLTPVWTLYSALPKRSGALYQFSFSPWLPPARYFWKCTVHRSISCRSSVFPLLTLCYIPFFGIEVMNNPS